MGWFWKSKKEPYTPPPGRFTGDIVTQLPGVRGPSLWGGVERGQADVIQPANVAGNFGYHLDRDAREWDEERQRRQRSTD